MSAKIIAAIIVLLIAVYALDSYMGHNDKKHVTWRDPLTDIVIIDINN